MVTVGCLPMLHSNGKAFGCYRAVSSLLVVGVMLGGEAMKVVRAYVGVKKARPTSGIPISLNTVLISFAYRACMGGPRQVGKDAGCGWGRRSANMFRRDLFRVSFSGLFNSSRILFAFLFGYFILLHCISAFCAV